MSQAKEKETAESWTPHKDSHSRYTPNRLGPELYLFAAVIPVLSFQRLICFYGRIHRGSIVSRA